VNERGLVQAAAAPPSRAQVTVYGATPPVGVNVQLTVVPLTVQFAFGLGAVRLIVHVNVAGDASALPAASVAATVNVWLPAARPV
jgi:hypothetical protein